jgi:hypothetical protein
MLEVKLFYLTYKCYNRKGFQKGEQLKAYIRHRHLNRSDNVRLWQKRKADTDWNESFEDIKRLRDDTRDLSNQFAALAIQLLEIVLLI